MTSTRLDDALHHLDPAATVQPARDADAVIRRALATAPDARPARARHHTPCTRRWTWATAGLVAASAAAVATWVGANSAEPAYAGWTHTPMAADAVRDHATAQQCRTWTEDTGPIHLAATPVLTDRRGDWALALLTTREGPVACMQDLRPAHEASGGLSGPIHLPTAVPRAGIVLDMAGGTSRDDGPIVRTVVGRAATDIRTVTLHTDAQGDVQATLVDGWLVAWWPGEQASQSIDGANGLLSRGFDSVRITRRDGTTVTLPASAVTAPGS